MGDLTTNFSSHEFACPCCGEAKVRPHFIVMLQDMRERFGHAIKISKGGGYRCEDYRQKLGAGPEHTDGEAADIPTSNSSERWELVQAALKAGFHRLGIYDHHIHVGCSQTLPHPVLWWGKSQ
jgi:hypothetical protein